MEQDVADIIFGVFGDDRELVVCQVELDQAACIGVAGILQVERLTIFTKVEWAATKGILWTPGEHGAPLVLFAVSYQEFVTTIGLSGDCASYFELSVGDPPCDIARIFRDEVKLAALQVQMI